MTNTADFLKAAHGLGLAGDDDGLRVVRPFPGVPWPTRGEERWSWEGEEGTGTLTHASVGSRWSLEMVRGGLSALEVHVEELGSTPAFAMGLSAPLPDPTRDFEGPVERRFIAYVNGLLHGHGTIVARVFNELPDRGLQGPADDFNTDSLLTFNTKRVHRIGKVN